jgi:hypothetical protein
MNSHRVNQFHPQVLVIFLVALGLLFAGVRVPEVSRPHRPKATHRVVLENHQKSFSNHLKQCADVVAVLPKRPTSSNSTSYHALSQVVPPLYASPLFFPNSGRSPPSVLS